MSTSTTAFIFFASLAAIVAGRLVDPECLQGSMSAMTCCPIPDFIGLPVMDECSAKVMDDKDSPMDMSYGATQEEVLFSPGIRCVAVCVMNYTRLIVNDTIDVDTALKSFTESFTGDAVWINVLRDAMHTCQAIVAKTQFKRLPADECSYLPAFYMTCLDTQMLRNCPAAHWKNEPGCAQMRVKAAQCPVLSAVFIPMDK